MFEFLNNKKIRVNPSENKVTKVIYLSIGFFFLIIGLIGSVLPIIPGFIFFIPAAYFLARASGRLNKWMKNNKYIGKYFHHE